MVDYVIDVVRKKGIIKFLCCVNELICNSLCVQNFTVLLALIIEVSYNLYLCQSAYEVQLTIKLD